MVDITITQQGERQIVNLYKEILQFLPKLRKVERKTKKLVSLFAETE
jgi:hypothetical protein